MSIFFFFLVPFVSHLSGLESENFQTRQAASDRLRELGLFATPAVIYGLMSQDPEVKYRCENLPISFYLIKVRWVPDIVYVHKVFTTRETGRNIENGDYWISDADADRMARIGGPRIQAIAKLLGWRVIGGGWEIDMKYAHDRLWVECWVNVVRARVQGRPFKKPIDPEGPD